MEDTSLPKILSNVGFIGLGAMGLPMALNVQAQLAEGYQLYVSDVNSKAIEAAVAKGAVNAKSPAEMATHVDVIVTMLPNDAVVRKVVTDEETGIFGESLSATKFSGIHIGCSTVHPETSRNLAQLHQAAGGSYIGAPVFARADGVAHRAASFVVGGDTASLEAVRPILQSMAKGIYTFGDDPGAGNVVKLCGNLMIAAAIQSTAEASALAESAGLDRQAVMEMLTSTIFDCLIYKGYGSRVAARQHIPGQPLVGPGFGLTLGLKDVSLAKQVAAEGGVHLPQADLLQQALQESERRGRGSLDWSASALLVTEEAGTDVSPWLPGGSQAADSGDSTAPM